MCSNNFSSVYSNNLPCYAHLEHLSTTHQCHFLGQLKWQHRSLWTMLFVALYLKFTIACLSLWYFAYYLRWYFVSMSTFIRKCNIEASFTMTEFAKTRCASSWLMSNSSAYYSVCSCFTPLIVTRIRTPWPATLQEGTSHFKFQSKLWKVRRQFLSRSVGWLHVSGFHYGPSCRFKSNSLLTSCPALRWLAKRKTCRLQNHCILCVIWGTLFHEELQRKCSFSRSSTVLVLVIQVPWAIVVASCAIIKVDSFFGIISECVFTRYTSTKQVQ